MTSPIQRPALYTLVRLVVAAITMLALDALWITLVIGKIYKTAVSSIQRGEQMHVRKGYALGAYIVLVLALATILHISDVAGWSKVDTVLIAAVWGALLYGSYAFTAASIFDMMPMHVVLADVLWGFTLFLSSTAVAVAFVSTKRSK